MRPFPGLWLDVDLRGPDVDSRGPDVDSSDLFPQDAVKSVDAA